MNRRFELTVLAAAERRRILLTYNNVPQPPMRTLFEGVAFLLSVYLQDYVLPIDVDKFCS